MDSCLGYCSSVLLNFWNISDCHQAQTVWFGKDFDNQHLASDNKSIPEPEGETLVDTAATLQQQQGCRKLQRGKCCLRQHSSRTGTFGVVWSLLDWWLTLSTIAGPTAFLCGHHAPLTETEHPWQSSWLLWLPVEQMQNASVGLHYEQEVVLCAVSASMFLVSISFIIFTSRICSLPMEGLWSLTMLDVQ